MTLRSPYFERLRAAIRDLGGLHNAHLHLDRAYTLEPEHLGGAAGGIVQNSHISLREKHGLIRSLHDSDAYGIDGLRARLTAVTDELLIAGTAIADTVVDVTDDRVGLTALQTMRHHAETVKARLTIRAASYNPFGFPSGDAARWDLFEAGAGIADFIGSLPERDDRRDYPDHIGFDEHCVRVLDLARRTGKFVHVHTDQRNDPDEDATERLARIVRREGAPPSRDGTPMVWAVHVISPSTYDEARFEALVDLMHEADIGVICCPSAALGMRQFRPRMTPTYNSIARVLEFAAAGLHVRLGSDNIADMCSPSTTADLHDELFILSAALRYYDLRVLARIAAGQRLTIEERGLVRQHLDRNAQEIQRGLRAPAPVS